MDPNNGNGNDQGQDQPQQDPMGGAQDQPQQDPMGGGQPWQAPDAGEQPAGDAPAEAPAEGDDANQGGGM